MKRFVASFFLGALALLVLYELSQASWWVEDEEAQEEVWYLTGYTHQRLAEALADEPTPQDAEALSTRLGVEVESISTGAGERACGEATVVTTMDGIQLCVGADVEDGVVAMLPFGPVRLDAELLFWEADEIVQAPHLVSLLVLILGMVLLGVGLGWPPARQLRALADTARALRDGDLEARAAVPRHGLAEPVALAFNEMADQLQETVQWQELMLQTVAHEVRTPLSRVRFIAERVHDAGDDAERGAVLEELDVELTELEALVSGVLSLVRAEGTGTVRVVPTDMTELVRGLADTLVRRQRHRSPPLVLERQGLEGEWPLAGVDRAAAARVVDNLLNNAAAHARSRVRVSLAPGERCMLVVVEDDGDGLSTDQRAEMFKPFVRLDAGRARTGTGLGLAIVKRLAEAHGHPVTVAESELGGLRVETRWPLATVEVPLA